MDYKNYLEEKLHIKLKEKDFTKNKYLNYLDSLKTNSNIIIPDDEAIKKIDENDSGYIIEYIINKIGGDASDIDIEEINTFKERLKTGYILIKYIEEIKTKY